MSVDVPAMTRIGNLLGQCGDALKRYGQTAETKLTEGGAAAQVHGFEREELAQLAEAWNRVGRALEGIQEAPAPAAGPRPHATDIEAGLTAVRDILNRQSP